MTLIILRDDEVLLIDRRRNGRSYFVIPGGGVEEGESLAQAARREAKEETSLDVELGPLLYARLWNNGDFGQMEYAFLVTGFEGTPLLCDPEILAKQSEDNIYQLQWIPLAELDGHPIYPNPIDLAVLAQINNH